MNILIEIIGSFSILYSYIIWFVSVNNFWLNKNPLENIESTKEIRAVIKKGVVYDQQVMSKMTQEIKTLNQQDSTH